MIAEHLYNLVRNLSKVEKSMFRKYVVASQKSAVQKPKYVLLYERFLKAPSYDDVKIRGKEFKDSKEYNRYREILLDKLVSCFAKGKVNTSNLAIIQTAIDLGAAKMAGRMLSKEYEEALEKEKLSYAYQLLEIADRFFQDYRVRLYKEDVLAGKKTLLNRLVRLDRLTDLHERCLIALNAPETHKRTLSAEINVVKSDFIPTSDMEGYWLAKLEIIQFRILNQFAAMRVSVVALSTRVLKGELKLRTGLQVKNLNVGMAAAIALKDKGVASSFLRGLSEIPAVQPQDDQVIQRSLITRTIDFGTVFFDDTMLEKGQEMLSRSQSSLPGWEAVKYWYFIAWAHLSMGNYPKGLRAINQLRQISTNEWGEMSWQPQVLQMLLAYKSGDLGTEGLLLATRRKLDSVPFHYPKLILKTVKQLHKCVTESDRSAVLKRAIENEKNALHDSNEIWQKQFLNFEAWLIAEKQGLTIQELDQLQVDQSALDDLAES